MLPQYFWRKNVHIFDCITVCLNCNKGQVSPSVTSTHISNWVLIRRDFICVKFLFKIIHSEKKRPADKNCFACALEMEKDKLFWNYKPQTWQNDDGSYTKACCKYPSGKQVLWQNHGVMDKANSYYCPLDVMMWKRSSWIPWLPHLKLNSFWQDR